jgi:hypothetical protein
MNKVPMCSECKAGGIVDSPAVALVRGSMVNPNTGRNMPFRKHVCQAHLDMLSDDTPRLQIVRRFPVRSEAYGIDSQGNVIVPAASAAVAKPLDELIPGFLEPNQQPQFQIENHGSITLFRPLNDAGREWLKCTAPEDARFMGSAMVVEPRYVGDVADAILSDGGVLS